MDSERMKERRKGEREGMGDVTEGGNESERMEGGRR